MRYTDIMTRARQIAGDLGANQFDDPTLITWINDGIRECAAENYLLQKRATSTLVVGTAEYTLPTDILKLYSMTVSGGKIQMMNLAQWQQQNFQTTETGLPVMAYVWAGKYTLWPTPDQAYTVEVDYIYDPVDLATGGDVNTVPPIPTSYHARLVDYVLAQVAAQDDDLNLYQMKMEEFHTGIKKLEDQSEQEEDVYPSINVSARDMGEGFFDRVEY